MTTQIVTPGNASLSSYLGADDYILRFMEGEQGPLSNCDKSGASRIVDRVEIGEFARIYTEPANPLKFDIATGARSQLIDKSPSSRPLHGYAAGSDNYWNVAKALGARGLSWLGGQLKEYHQRGGAGMAGGSGRVDALYQFGGTYTAQKHAVTNNFTDILLRDATLISERGFTGTCRVWGNSRAVFKLADNSTGTPPAGVTLEIYGGSVEWGGGNITTLKWFGGDFDLRKIPGNITITNLHITWDNLDKLQKMLRSMHATVTLPSSVFSTLFVYGSEFESTS